ncbi:MAG TPA: hypothetical protein VFZ12_02890 [Dehalococcoidia bacterium]|nr:hypothetical protein [Dehalococcoidia bacterium]
MPPKSTTALLDRLDAAAEEFGRDLHREYYLNGAGLKEDLVLAPIFERFDWLFQRSMVDQLQQMRPSDERYFALREFVLDTYMEDAVKSLSERIADRETTDTIDWDGKRVPYRSIQPLIANESNPERRRDLDGLRARLTGEQNELREERWDILHQRACDLGYATYVDFCDDVSRLRLHDLKQMVEAFLWDTEKVYRDRLERFLRDTGIPPARAEKCDLAFLFRAPQYDSLFPKRKLQYALDETLKGLGIDLKSQPNVYLDTETRPQKSPRAFCSTIEVPGEIKLVINPQGGQDDYRALLHEAGHTEHFAHVPPELPYAFRGLGDNSVTEGFAFLVEHLMKDEAWLAQVMGIEDSAAFIAFSNFHELYLVRRYCAKLIYELELHSSDSPRARGKRYADLLTATVGVRYSPADYLFDVDDGFYAAKYLRAWIFEAQVRKTLEDRFGPLWFQHPEGGAQVREWWSYGQRYTAEGLLQRAGHPGLDIGPLTRALKEG